MKDKLPGPSSENEQQPDQYLATTPVETPAEHEEDDYGSEEEQSHWKKLDDKINRLQAEICWAMEQKKKENNVDTAIATTKTSRDRSGTWIEYFLVTVTSHRLHFLFV